MIPTANQIYKHFKGNLYRIITIAKDSETGEDVVVYQALYGEYVTYTRALANFIEVLDRGKYPEATQVHRFEAVQEMVEPVLRQDSAVLSFSPDTIEEQNKITQNHQKVSEAENMEEICLGDGVVLEDLKRGTLEDNSKPETDGEEVTLDPMLEAYLDTDSYREKLNILHGLRHRITDHMLLTMAVVIDFELPEGSIESKYDALNDCLVTRERYECNRMN